MRTNSSNLQSKTNKSKISKNKTHKSKNKIRKRYNKITISFSKRHFFDSKIYSNSRLKRSNTSKSIMESITQSYKRSQMAWELLKDKNWNLWIFCPIKWTLLWWIPFDYSNRWCMIICHKAYKKLWEILSRYALMEAWCVLFIDLAQATSCDHQAAPMDKKLVNGSCPISNI